MVDHTKDERPVVAGVFRNRDDASRAIAALVEAHFEPAEDISVVMTEEWTLDRENIPIREELELIEGAEIGGGVGALLGATGASLVAAGLLAGPAALLAAGPVVAALQGGLAVGAFGVVTGWLMGLGIQREEADFHASHIGDGAIWIGVHGTGDRAVRAAEILDECGAQRYRPGSSPDAGR